MLEVLENMLLWFKLREQVAKSQREMLIEMNNNMNDHAVRVMTRGGRMT